jgi:dephospho-CoA kinase
VFGDDLLAQAMARDVKESDDELIIVDGARRMNDLKYLKEVPGFHLIRIDADQKIRYERMIKRNENKGEADTTYEQFLADHQKETEATIPEVMDNAEFSIDNNGNLESLYTQIDKIIEKVKD